MHDYAALTSRLARWTFNGQTAFTQQSIVTGVEYHLKDIQNMYCICDKHKDTYMYLRTKMSKDRLTIHSQQRDAF